MYTCNFNLIYTFEFCDQELRGRKSLCNNLQLQRLRLQLDLEVCQDFRNLITYEVHVSTNGILVLF